MNKFITPTHPGQTITPVAVTTPGEAWPLTGILRLIGLAFADPRLFGPGGAGWPDEPWWKLSGLFDLTGDQSAQAGVADLEQAMAVNGNDHLVIYGYSQGSIIVNLEKQRLAEQYPAGTAAPDIDFVLGGDFGVPNGGLYARFPGLYIPVLDWLFHGPEPTNTQFHTDVITRQYDAVADFPLYPLNLIADLNAVLGFLYVHAWPFDVSLPPDPTTSPAYQGTHGDTSYYFFETQDLPLFAPLRMLGVPEALIDVVEPFFRVIVELGYDRTIPPWEPTPARLIPPLNPVNVITDLVGAVGKGINDGLALVGSPAQTTTPTPARVAAPVAPDAAPVADTGKADDAPPVSTDAPTDTEQMSKEATKHVTETVEAEEVSTRPTAVDTPEPSASDSTSETAKPAGRPATSRPVVRDSLKSGDQEASVLRPGNGGRSISRPGADDEKVTAESSSPESSPADPPSGDGASGGDSSDGDAGEP
jgi:hypothetical protein